MAQPLALDLTNLSNLEYILSFESNSDFKKYQNDYSLILFDKPKKNYFFKNFKTHFTIFKKNKQVFRKPAKVNILFF
jgi:hypothetical protein